MAFLDDFSKKAKEFADVASEKAKEAAGNAKAVAATMAEVRELDKSYKAIGEWYVSQLEGDAPEAVADLVAAARASQVKIAELQAARQKETAEPERKCPLCGAESSGKFCPQCGAPMGD